MSVYAYLIQRLQHAVLVVLGVSLIVFILMYLTGDPATLMLPTDATAEQIETFRRAMGFDRPIHEQYLTYLGRAVRGDLGLSLRHRQPAMSLVIERFPATIELSVAAFVVALGISVPLGIISAVKRGSLFDSLATVVAMVGISVPIFWLGIVLILVVSVNWGLLPASGRGGIDNLVLPAITLGMFMGPMITRLLRSSLIDVLKQDYIRTARSKGLAERVVIYKHALKNASLPVITVLGLQIGAMMGGSIITETVFAYPGMGLLAIQAIRNRDVPVVQAFVLVVALIILTANLTVDLLYTYLDPRITYS